jgi:hypothetical protein
VAITVGVPPSPGEVGVGVGDPPGVCDTVAVEDAVGEGVGVSGPGGPPDDVTLGVGVTVGV